MKRHIALWMMTLTFCMIVTATLVFAGTGTIKAGAGEKTGAAGSNLVWELKSDGTLIVSGEGAMYNATRSSGFSTGGPWHIYKNSIYRAVFKEGVTTIGLDAFYECSALRSVELPSSLESIMDGAFWGCKSLTSVTIPEGVSYIHFDAFKDCDSLSEIRVARDNACFASAEGILLTKDRKEMLTVPKRLLTSSSITIPEGVQIIGDSAFYENKTLERIHFPSTLKRIGSQSFYSCTSLKAIEFPRGLEHIGYKAFYNCSNLKSVTLPSSITSMNSYVFVNCKSLETATFEEGTKEIFQDIFSGVSSLKTVYIPSTVKKIGNYAFSECTGLRTIYYGGTEQSWNLDIIFGNDNIPYLFPKYAPNLMIYYKSSLTSLANAKVVLTPTSFTYDGRSNIPSVKVVLNGTTLVKGVDYTASFVKSVGPGTAQVIVMGAGRYTGVLYAAYEIKPTPTPTPTAKPVTNSGVKPAANPGTKPAATVTPAASGSASGKKENSLKVSTRTVTVKASKKKQTIAVKKVFNVTGAQGKVSYRKISGAKQLTISKTGKITVAKKTKKGTYKIKVAVTASGNSSYKSKTIEKTVKVKVKK